MNLKTNRASSTTKIMKDSRLLMFIITAMFTRNSAPTSRNCSGFRVKSQEVED